MPFLIVEYDHDPPLTDEALNKDSAALSPCLQVRGITRLRSWISADRRRAVCEFRAADAESVREAYRNAGVAYARMWSGTLYEAGMPPES